MLVPKRCFSLIVIGLIVIGLSVSCNGDQGSQRSTPQRQPTQPFLTWTPVTEGSANLHYQLITNNAPLLTAVQTDVIPLKWKFDPEHPKDPQAILTGIDNGSFFVQVAGSRGGEYCFFWFDIPVEIDVWGNFKPAPECSFDFSITAKPGSPITERDQNCGVEAEERLQQYPAEVLFMPPPSKIINLSGDLTITIPVDEATTIKLTLTDVVVPEATGCQW